MDIKSPQKVLHIFSRALENFSSFGFVKGWLECRAKPNVLKCAAGKKKLKMRVGKNFKKHSGRLECCLVDKCQSVKERF